MVLRGTSSSGSCSVAAFLVLLWLALSAAAVAQSAGAHRQPGNWSLNQLVNEGQELAAQGRFAEAEVPAKQAAELAPGNYTVLTLLGKIEGRLGKRADSIVLLRQVARGEPKVADAHLNLAITLADAGNFEEALTETSTAVTLSPKLFSAHYNRARVLADLHRPEEAEKEFAAAHRLAPNNPDCLFYWALFEKDQSHLDQQTALLQQLVRLQPDNLTALLLLAQSLQNQRKDAETIAVLRHMLQLKPDSENALYMLSMELRRSDPEGSKKLQQDFEAQKRKKADLARVKSLGMEAYEAANKKDWPEAIRILRQALASCPDCEYAAALHKNLGLALCGNENFDEGKQELEKSLSMSPNDPDVVKALNVIAQRQ